MRKNPGLAILIGALLLPLAGCNDPQNTRTAEQSYGPSPTLPAPQSSMIPTINVATATSWPPGVIFSGSKARPSVNAWRSLLPTHERNWG